MFLKKILDRKIMSMKSGEDHHACSLHIKENNKQVVVGKSM
jgi:hypothetical protein